MEKKRYFIKGALETGDTVTTDDRHIQVMRHSIGDEVVLFNGDGNDVQALKCSELGVKAFVPFVSRNTVVTMNTNRAERLRRIAEESGKQCKRSALMHVHHVMTFSEALMAAEGCTLKLFAYEKETARGLFSAMQAAEGAKDIALLVGCEGGFTAEEAAKAVRAGFVAVSLGKTILKADTAAVAGAAAVLCCAKAWEPS